MRVVGVVLALLALAGCGGREDDDSTTVVVAFYPLAWAAERIGGEGVEVVNLTPPGTEPHDVELSARDVEKVRAADLILYVGGGFQPSVEDAIERHEGPLLDALAREDAADPHVWLDPLRFAGISVAVGAALGRPLAADEVWQKLRALDLEYRHGLERCERGTLVTTHAAFGYLAARYGLTQLSLAGRSPEAEPGPRELERLIKEVRASEATTVFAEPLVSDRLAEIVAREAGARVVVLDPLEGLTEEQLIAGEDYLSVMRRNLTTLREALGCR